MSKCYLCPRACGVDREKGERGFCKEGSELRVARYSLHMWEEPVIAVVGGFGMMNGNINRISCTAEAVKQTANELLQLDIGYIYTCHCTGRKGYEIMKEVLENQISTEVVSVALARSEDRGDDHEDRQQDCGLHCRC